MRPQAASSHPAQRMGQRISAQAESSFKSVVTSPTGKVRPTSGLPLPRNVQSPCADAREHALPLPTTVPPAAFVSFEHQVLAFLQSGQYRQLGWCRDKGSEHSPVRDTGPFSKGVYYGTHPAVRIYYSPRAMKWLIDGRQGPIPDGAMIIKEQYHPPAARYSGLSDDQLPQVTDWTIMIKDSAGAKDGWFWGEFFDTMTFDDDKPPFQYPWAGFGLYCLRCHATAEKEHTFSALNNIQGFPGKPIEFSDDGSWRGQPIAKRDACDLVGACVCKQAAESDLGIPPDVHVDPRRGAARRRKNAVGNVRSRGRAGGGRSVHQLQCVHVLSRRAERAVRADHVPAFASGPDRHCRRRQRLAVRRMALVADGPGRAGSDILRATGKRARVSRHAATSAKRRAGNGTDERLPELSRRHGQAAARHRRRRPR